MAASPSFKASWPALAKILCLLLLVIGGNLVAKDLADAFGMEIRPGNEETVHRLLMIAASVYAVLIAIPFVPGVELGLTLIALLGPPIVFLIYLSTLAGLSIGYATGRLIPLRHLVALLERAGLHRAGRLVADIDGQDSRSLQKRLAARTHSKVLLFLLKYRYLALILAINLPGNFLLGGGGGIAMMAGLSRMFSPPGFLLAIAVAVAPLPLAIVLFGDSVIDALTP
jgi:hypothetical protein